MLVTLFGMVMLVRPSQPENAEPPMLVTPFGMVMLVRLLQPQNAYLPMLVTLSGMAYEVYVLPSGYLINSVFSLLKRTPFSLEYTVLAVSTLI